MGNRSCLGDRLCLVQGLVRFGLATGSCAFRPRYRIMCVSASLQDLVRFGLATGATGAKNLDLSKIPGYG